LKHFSRTPLGLGDGRKHQVAQELRVAVLKNAGINPDGADCSSPIGGDLYHAATGRSLDRARCQLRLELLQTTLDLLAKLKELLKICHAIG
jgi:hypothetical protein